MDFRKLDRHRSFTWTIDTCVMVPILACIFALIVSPLAIFATHSDFQFAARIRELVAGHAMLEQIAEAMLRAREGLRAEFDKLHHRAMLTIARPGGSARVSSTTRSITVGGYGGRPDFRVLSQ